MTPRRSSQALPLAVAVLVLVVLPLAACTETAKAPPSPPSSKHEAVVLRYSDPGNAGVLAYAKREGVLERALAKVNATIEWVPGAQAFSANFEAMNSGAINASGGAISPIVGALAHNLKFKISASPTRRARGRRASSSPRRALSGRSGSWSASVWPSTWRRTVTTSCSRRWPTPASPRTR